MAYFENFPLYFYNLSNDSTQKSKIVANVLARVKMIDSVKNASYVYYKYDVQDGETPEILAAKYYDNPNRHWIILFANDIIDPVYDWPMSSTNFNNYIIDKYGSYVNSVNTIHHYEKVVTKLDSVTNTTTIKKFEIDLDTYNSLSSSSTQTYNLKDGNTVTITTTKQSVSCFDYENELNESKRSIKIIDKAYVNVIENELIGLLNTNV